jgi:hypothetical protein
MSKALRVVYILVILLLFGVAGALGSLCIHYDRKPEGIIIIGSAVVVLVISVVVALSGAISKDDKKVAKAKAKQSCIPADAVLLMTMKCTVQTYRNGEITSKPQDAVIKLYDEIGVYIQVGQDRNKMLLYDDVDDIYKETDDDFFIGMNNGREYKFKCPSIVKLMALEDILNKQTDYRFDENEM